jgi:ABC-type sugar transport system ATPase subunit
VCFGPSELVSVPLAAAGIESGRPVVAGIRPENIRIGAGGLDAAVTLTEDLGHETQVFLTIGGTSFVARAPAGFRAKAGDALKVAFDPAAIHLFDPVSGARIETGTSHHG